MPRPVDNNLRNNNSNNVIPPVTTRWLVRDLRAFALQHNLEVQTNVGGHNRRTKAQFVSDVNNALDDRETVDPWRLVASTPNIDE
eukprot:m.181629 g.181629  ORF g.181629 m.181629 type:complete len:85 (+) comp16873_c0_seq3:145-399(+)